MQTPVLVRLPAVLPLLQNHPAVLSEGDLSRPSQAALRTGATFPVLRTGLTWSHPLFSKTNDQPSEQLPNCN